MVGAELGLVGQCKAEAEAASQITDVAHHSFIPAASSLRFDIIETSTAQEPTISTFTQDYRVLFVSSFPSSHLVHSYDP